MLQLLDLFGQVVPDDASRLADFQKIMNTCSEFETVLKKLSFISNSDKNDERLSNFADNVEVHFAVRKKTEILASARQSILQCDFSIPRGIGYEGGKFRNGGNSDHVVDLLFSSEKCVVSEAASKLMKLVHQTLQDVCVSSPRVALEFYYAARDALQLYEAIIPIKLERQLDNINQSAVLMHNDCLDVSQEVLGLSFEVVFILEKIRLLWEPVLLPSTYKRSFCVIFESVFSRITQDILLLDDIAAEESLQLQRLMHYLLESLKSLNFERISDQCYSRPLEADVPCLGKFRKLADLLDMPLNSITEAWEYGDLYGCGFILTEVVDFVKAIFTDSPLRKECLTRIYRINF